METSQISQVRRRTETNNPSINFQPRRRITSNNHEVFSVLISFLPVAVIFFFYLVINQLLANAESEMGNLFYLFIISSLFTLSNIIAFVVLWSIMDFGIYWRSSMLSNVFLIGFMVSTQKSYPALICFGYYLMSLSFFHLSEYTFTALFNQKKITNESFLLNHSMEYGLAAFASWLEFFIEVLIVPDLKLNLYARLAGLSLIMFGELFRKLAMYQAGTNFNHYVQENRKTDHVLVTSGVYAFFRHPSYFGWFIWSIGTQILLANPICIILYTVASWKFFNSRIIYEEYYLLKFFGRQYLEYQAKVSSGIPFVVGYVTSEESLD